MGKTRRLASSAALAASAGILAACTSQTVTTTATAPATSSTPKVSASASKAAAEPSPSPSASTATIGDSLTLSGTDPGEQVKVTLVKVLPDAAPADNFSSPDAGKRFYAAQFRLNITGSKTYSDSPDNSAKLTDSQGQSYDSWIQDVAGCQAFSSGLNIAPGGTGLGCVTFEIPQSAKITQVQFTLDSGFADDTGQWKAS